jgi:hypothetical protein
MAGRKQERVSSFQNDKMESDIIQKRCPVGIFFFFYTLSFLTACVSENYIKHEIKPSLPFKRDFYSTRAEVRTVEATIGAEILSEKQFATLVRTYPFSNSFLYPKKYQHEKLTAVVLTVTNYSDSLIAIERPLLKFNDEANVKPFVLNQKNKNQLELSSIKTNDFIIHTPERRFDYIDNEYLTIYKFSSIVPGDTILVFYFFPKALQSQKEITLAVPLNTDNGKKTVELSFTRIESIKKVEKF